jgi:hypothetical protein
MKQNDKDNILFIASTEFHLNLSAKKIIERNSISSYYNHIFRKNKFIRIPFYVLTGL